MLRFAICSLALAATLFAADSKDVHKTVAVNANGSVTLHSHKGSIHVSTWDRPDVDIQARIQAEPGSNMSQRIFDGTEIAIDSTQDSVRIQTKYPETNWCCANNETSPEVNYTIQMPRTAKLTIVDHCSTTEISGLGGGLDLDTHRGTAHVHHLSGPLHLTTHRGDIDVEFASFSGNSSVETHSGAIELALPRNTAFNLDTDLSRHGSIDSDFPMTLRASSRMNQNAHGTVNGGGPTLKVETYRGHIRVRAI
jgi:hypothetical protein